MFPPCLNVKRGGTAAALNLKSGRHSDKWLESIVSSVKKKKRKKNGAQEWVIFPGAVKK